MLNSLRLSLIDDVGNTALSGIPVHENHSTYINCYNVVGMLKDSQKKPNMKKISNRVIRIETVMHRLFLDQYQGLSVSENS